MIAKQYETDNNRLSKQQAPYPWQQTLTDRWLRMLNAGQLPSAVLLTGTASSGKSDLARFWVSNVLCECRAPQGGYCGKCRSCRLLVSNTHPDFWWTNCDDAQLTVDWAREFNLFWQRTASRGGFKIAVIERAERLNLAAANALLKTVEELPEFCCVIFITDKPGRLPITLRSRLVVFKLQLTDKRLVRNWLVQQNSDHVWSDERLTLVQRMLPLSPLLAVERLNNIQFWDDRKLLFEQLAELDKKSNFSSLAQMWSTKQSANEFLQFWLDLIQDLLKIKLGLSARVLNVDQRELLVSWTSGCSMEGLVELEKWIWVALSDGQRFNINDVLLFETLFYKWERLVTP